MTVVERLSALEEDRVLDYFWLMDRQGADRHELLLQLREVRVQRPSDWNKRKIRHWHEVEKMRVGRGTCFCCRKSGPVVDHHLVQIQHGGSNDLRNRVALCFVCHRRVHPWLEDTTPVTGFVRVRDVLASVAARLVRSA